MTFVIEHDLHEAIKELKILKGNKVKKQNMIDALEHIAIMLDEISDIFNKVQSDLTAEKARHKRTLHRALYWEARAGGYSSNYCDEWAKKRIQEKEKRGEI